MDNRRFDDLAKAMGTGASRRRVLAGMAGLALGVVGRGRARADITVGDYITGRYCGGIAGIPCPDGYGCVDDVGDNCFPDAGGADCSGTCQPIPTVGGCAATLCEVGTTCCDICGRGTCVPAGQPCPLALCVEEECNQVTCGAGEFCCNHSCSICAPVGGFCTQEFCGGETCGNTVCGEGEYCCNPSCGGFCAPFGAACPQIACP